MTGVQTCALPISEVEGWALWLWAVAAGWRTLGGDNRAGRLGTQITYNLSFTDYLVLWSSATGVADGSGTPPPNGSLAEGTYAVILEQPWSITSLFTITDVAGHATGVGSVTVDPTAAATFQPVLPAGGSGAVLVPPRVLDVSADNVKH